MSIDHHFYVPAGMRDSTTRRFGEFKYNSYAAMKAAGHPDAIHQTFLAHGEVGGVVVLIDEQFYFEDAEDARWFHREGYKRVLYDGEEEPDRKALFIDGHEVDFHVLANDDGRQFCE